MHEHDYFEDWRRFIIPKLGGIANWLEQVTGDRYYVEAETHNNQFVGRVPMGEEEFEQVLDDLGFERNPLASLKHLPSGETEEGSWRKIGDDDRTMQLHVVLYDGSTVNNAETDVTYVYAHWELRWDVSPWGHYRGHGFDPDEGVKKMKKLLDEAGVSYEAVRP